MSDQPFQNSGRDSSQPPSQDPWLEVLGSRHLTASRPGWPSKHISLACSTYQTAKLFLIGRGNSGNLSVFERTFNRCMGLWSDGRVRYVTVVSQSDVTDGWRDRRRDAGCVIDVRTGDVVIAGLSMPHSPRFYRDRLWVLNSGAGQLGFVDLQRGVFEPVAFCPGYLRGRAFAGDFALVTLSKPRRLRCRLSNATAA